MSNLKHCTVSDKLKQVHSQNTEPGGHRLQGGARRGTIHIILVAEVMGAIFCGAQTNCGGMP